jgi:fibronectin type 3 domain-containing protein
MGNRNNPFDSGGDNWTENAPPEITASIDSLWADFNHSCTTGSILLHLSGDDRNFPYDTMYGTVYFNSTARKLPQIITKDNFPLLFDKIKPATSLRCSVVVFDKKNAATANVFTIVTPASTPPQPPSAKITSGTQDITISWQPVPKARFYTVYFSDTLSGPYSDSIVVNQSGSSIITIKNSPYTYLPRYYVLSTTGESVASRSTDTLIGRRYTRDIYSPQISSMTATYTYLEFSIYASYSSSSIHHFEIYRSTKDTSSFRLLATVPFTGNSYATYKDSVTTSDTYYYKVATIDKLGRSSYPSTTLSGTRPRLPAPQFSATQYVDHLKLSWYSSADAAYYRIYRSIGSCPDSLDLLDSTALTVYADTLPTSEIYYYSLSAVDSYGREGLKSSCTFGKILILPPPDSLKATKDFYPRHVALSWKKVAGSEGYIVYNNDSAINIPIDTIYTTEFVDSLHEKVTRRYQVAAFNKKGIGALSNSDYGSIISPKISGAYSNNDSIHLSWLEHSRAMVYYIYRSLDTISFKLVDSSFTTSYNGRQEDFSTYFYRITIRVPEGVSYPGTPVSITRKLTVPQNFRATDQEKGVILQWSRVEGAESYVLYRSLNSSANSIYRTITDTFFMDTLPSMTSRYYYRVAAKKGSLTSPASNVISGGIIGRPLTPTSITLTGQILSIRLAWMTPIASSHPDGFRIYRSSTAYGSFVLIGTSRNLEFYDSVPDTLRYYYQISAYNSYGESPTSSTYNSTRIKPPAPTNVTASQATSKDHIRISWSPVNSITKYGVYRALTATDSYYHIGSVTNSTVYDDSSCDVNTNYYYLVASQITGNRSLGSQYTRGIRLGPPTVTETIKSNGITIIWKQQPYTVQRYYIYKANAITGPYSKVDSTTGTSYFDATYTGLSYYKLSSFNTVESDLSNEVTNDYTAAPAAPVSIVATQGTESNMIFISWTASEHAIGYRLYRAPTDSFNRDIKLVAEIASTSYKDTVSSDSIYYYRVKAFNYYGENGLVAGAAAGYRRPTRKAYPPTGLYVSPGIDGIYIGWQKPSTAIGFNKYTLFRATSPDGPFEIVITTENTNFNDVPPEKSPTVYWYIVTAENQYGNSSPSEMVSGSQGTE